jgi:hypothetical protein
MNPQTLIQNIELNTEIGMFGIWDSKSLSFINTEDEYKRHFVKDKDLLELMNRGVGVFWGTGGDGVFYIEVALNRDPNDEDKSHIISKSIDNKLVLTDSHFFLGSPEAVGSAEIKALEDGHIKNIAVDAGVYSVDVYFIYSDADEEKTRFYVNVKSVDKNFIFQDKLEFPVLG